MTPLHSKLENKLKDILPSARLEVTSLLEVPELQLLLLAQDYPQGNLSQQEMQRVMDNPLYWIFCWASGQVLAKYLTEHADWVKGKRVLDFGCGSGVVAIAAALSGAAQVIACDIDPLALEATRINAELNGVELILSDDFFTIEGEIEIIIASDVLYDRENFPWLQRFVERTDQVLLADSRVKNFQQPPYLQIERRDSCTLPDLEESVEFRDVRIYFADNNSG